MFFRQKKYSGMLKSRSWIPIHNTAKKVILSPKKGLTYPLKRVLLEMPVELLNVVLLVQHGGHVLLPTTTTSQSVVFAAIHRRACATQ